MNAICCKRTATILAILIDTYTKTSAGQLLVLKLVAIKSVKTNKQLNIIAKF